LSLASFPALFIAVFLRAIAPGHAYLVNAFRRIARCIDARFGFG